MKFKRGQVINCLWAKKENQNGTITMEPRPTIVLRDTMNNPDVVTLVYCSTQNKELLYDNSILIDEDSDDFFLMGLDRPTYIIPQINKNIEIDLITSKRGFCSDAIMDQIDSIIETWLLKGSA